MEGQTSTTLEQLGFMPATVCGHTRHDDGWTLRTIDPDPDSNIEMYDDERAPHRSGNPPEADDE